ncbi:LLM class flavin-dependent oxidoreductase [Nocardia mexicana]|nr:LLM class flavin-dependent oxidoreductase [Nocardia mexicana]
MKYSILMPFATPRAEQILPYAALTQWSRAHRLWQGQALTADPYQAFSFMAAGGFRMPVGVGVTLMPFRHPLEAALQARSAAVTMGHPIVAGFGPGGVNLQRSMLGTPYRSQLTAVREYLTIVRSLLDGETVRFGGEYFSCFAALPEFPAPPVEVGAGVLRPAMARLAGAVADVAITWLTPAAYLREVVVPEMQAGADESGRPRPRLVAMVPLALSGPHRDGVEMALASNTAHLSLPHYRDMLGRSGITVDRKDLRSGGRAIVDGGAFLYGTAKELAAMLADFGDAGVDELVLNVTGVAARFGTQTALEDLDTILSEVSS